MPRPGPCCAALGLSVLESCEGGAGHTHAEPTVGFHGDRSEGYRALTAVRGLRVQALRRVWPIVDREANRDVVGIHIRSHHGHRGYGSRAHSAHSGFPPVPSRRFSFSMLLPVLQFVLLW